MKGTVAGPALWSLCVLCFALGALGEEPAADAVAEPGFFGFFFDTEEEGVRVTGLHADGPAAAVGVEPGDRIVSIDGTDLRGMSHVDFHELLARYHAGDSARLTVLRGGRLSVVQFSLTRKPEELRMTAEERARHRRLLEQDEAIGTVLRLVEQADVLLIRRSDDGETLVKPVADGTSWTVATPALADILNRASRGAVTPLEPGEVLEVGAILGDNSLELEVRRKVRDPESSASP